MRWAVVFILILLILGLYYFTDSTKEFIGLVIANLDPVRESVSSTVSP